MLFNPNSMPDYGRNFKRDQKTPLRSTGKTSKVNHREREKSKHREPDIYVDHFVSKRKS